MKTLPDRPNIEHLHKQAKELLTELQPSNPALTLSADGNQLISASADWTACQVSPGDSGIGPEVGTGQCPVRSWCASAQARIWWT